MLENRDYTLIIDKSGSMSTKDQAGGRSRWDIMQESARALAAKCEEFDPDGITVYTFSTRFRRYDHVTASKVDQIFQENEPIGRTEMADVLKDAFQGYFRRKGEGQAKPNGETILVVTDGQPDNRDLVMAAIIEATHQMDRDEELGVSFIQIGNDPDATKFLKLLDDQLQSADAKFDIVDTINIQEIEEESISLKEVLLKAIQD
jgi:Mg-chelatase subunit ChlD